MKRVTGKEFARVLVRRGWTLNRIESSHHFYTKPGHPYPLNVPIHPGKTLKVGTQRALMKQAGLTDADL